MEKTKGIKIREGDLAGSHSSPARAVSPAWATSPQPPSPTTKKKKGSETGESLSSLTGATIDDKPSLGPGQGLEQPTGKDIANWLKEASGERRYTPGIQTFCIPLYLGMVVPERSGPPIWHTLVSGV
ncbi:Uncharacterized protein HZ326_27469 [Fusarium oxysporum f. sp. albedinis]|nr:Uncharacterized protein HZ326_27469 [Fusarium oxysporum f. sp. albedinis]